MSLFSTAKHEPSHVTPCKPGESFEDCVRRQIYQANVFTFGDGSDAPWEALMEHVIALEKRVVELEDRGGHWEDGFRAEAER